MFRIVSFAALLGCQALFPADPVMADGLTGLWTLTAIDGAPVAFAATLDLTEPGKLTGQAPCNSYGGKLSLDGAAFIPGPILSTKMACDGMADENRYLEALQMVESAEVSGDELVLTGEQVLEFSRNTD